MTTGKVAAQAGHAYLGAIKQAHLSTPKLAHTYQSESIGTKVCLSASLEQILKAQDKAQELGVPYFLVVDEGCANFYDGQPTITAIGFGPSYKQTIKPVTGKLALLK